MTRLIAILAVLFMLSACGDSPGPSPAQDARAGSTQASGQKVDAHGEHAAAEGGIAWFDGDVDAAFAIARAEDKPIFLYWGAVWCPPCQQIKATIFSRREFIERSRFFVPVYLDGDTQSAQELGERFGVLGYPTMIVFAPDATEITRIPGGINVELYGSVLDLALQQARPVKDLVRAAVDGHTLALRDYKLLAYYSWGQDNEHALAGVDSLELLGSLARSCPQPQSAECSRLYIEYLQALFEAEAESPGTLTAAQHAEALQKVRAILANPELYAANMYLLLYGADDLTGALTEPGSEERKQLMAEWNSALEYVAADESVSTTERLNTAGATMSLLRLQHEDGPLPDAFLDALRARVAWADENTDDAWERQTVINSAWYLLSEAGLQEQATAMLEAELGKSKSPYYFMVDLASLAQKAGRTEEAIDWLRRAWDEAEGPATRFQWGAFYVLGLLEMIPEQAQRIETESLRVLSQLEARDDAFFGRNKRYLARLEKNLLSWNEDGSKDAQIAVLRDAVRGMCVNLPAENPSRSTCESFLTAG